MLCYVIIRHAGSCCRSMSTKYVRGETVTMMSFMKCMRDEIEMEEIMIDTLCFLFCVLQGGIECYACILLSEYV